MVVVVRDEVDWWFSLMRVCFGFEDLTIVCEELGR